MISYSVVKCILAKFDDMFNCFHTIQKCYKGTDEQAGRQTDQPQHTPRDTLYNAYPVFSFSDFHQAHHLLLNIHNKY